MKSLALFLLTLCLSAPAAAQPRGTGARMLTVEAALREAVLNNHELQSARLEVEKADARVDEAWSTVLPRIDLSARYTHALKLPVFFLPDFDDPNSGRVTPVEIGSPNAVDVNLSAQQILFNSAVFVGVGTAATYAKAARSLYRANELATFTAVRKAFYGALVAREVETMMRETLRNAEENARTVRALAAQGLVAEYDLLRAEVAVENTRPELLDAENNRVLALNNLKRVIGAAYDDSIDVKGEFTLTPVDSSLVRHAVDSVLAANPGLDALRLQAKVSDAVISVERSEYLPTLSAFGTYQSQAVGRDLKFSTGDFITSSQVGLQLSINLFRGWGTNARVEQAQIDFRKAQEQIASAETSLPTMVESIVRRINVAEQRARGQKRTIEQAERGLRIAQRRFSSGSGTQLEVIDSQVALNRAKVNHYSAIYDYLTASAELDEALGRVPPGLDTGNDTSHEDHDNEN